MTKKSVKSSKLGRLTQLGKSIAKAGTTLAIGVAKEKSEELITRGKELSKDLEYRARAAQEIVKTMGELKGGLMKIGQMISISEDLVLPKEITALFAQLQKSATSIPEKEVKDLFVKHFGKGPDELFVEFDINPVAAASIGQVHRAVLPTGEKVAIKVQYPSIVEAIRADFNNVERIKKLFSVIFPELPNIDHTIEEVKETILNECDYTLEAANMEKFREMYRDEFPDIVIPGVYKEWSNSEILTMDFIEGDSFEETLNYSQADKDKLGSLLFDTYMYSFYTKGLVHSDPQNGNYLFRPGKIILLDFGCIREFSREFRVIYSSMLLAVENDDIDLYHKSILELGFCMPEDGIDYVQNHFNLVKQLYSPYFKEGSYPIGEMNPFNLVNNFVKSIKIKGRSAPRKEVFHLDRSTLGMYTKIKAWKCPINWQEGRRHFRTPLDQEIESFWKSKESAVTGAP